MITESLFLKRAMNSAAPADYVNWAVERLIEGLDTPALRILAGLNPRLERDDIEPCFKKVDRWHKLPIWTASNKTLAEHFQAIAVVSPLLKEL
jgi:hypothetical protein